MAQQPEAAVYKASCRPAVQKNPQYQTARAGVTRAQSLEEMMKNWLPRKFHY